MTPRLFPVLVLGLLTLVGSPVDAAPVWGPGTDAQTSTDADFGVDLAVNDGGAGVLAYSSQLSAGGAAVMVSFRAPGESWTPPVPVDPGPEGGGTAGVRVGIAADGSSVVAWTRHSGTGGGVQYATYSPQQVGGPSRTLGQVVDGFPSDLELAVNPAGRAALTWVEPTGPWGARGSVAAGLGEPFPLQRSTRAMSTEVAINASGDVLFAWTRVGSNARQMVARALPVGAGLRRVRVLDGRRTGQSTGSPALALADDGSAVLVYRRTVGGAPATLRYATRSRGTRFATGTWSRTRQATPTGVAALRADVVLTKQGRTVLTYTWQGRVYATSRTTGAFAAPQALTGASATAGDAPELAVGRRGDVALAGLVSTGSSTEVVVAQRRRSAGAFRTGPATPGADGLERPAVDVDDQGNAYVVAIRRRCLEKTCQAVRSVLESRYLDAAGPSLTSLTAPRELRRGATGTFTAVGVTDRVSTFEVRWDFGDGTTGSGAMAEHAYAQRGTYRARAFLTDAHGNTRKVTRTVTVTR